MSEKAQILFIEVDKPPVFANVETNKGVIEKSALVKMIGGRVRVIPKYTQKKEFQKFNIMVARDGDGEENDQSDVFIKEGGCLCGNIVIARYNDDDDTTGLSDDDVAFLKKTYSL